MKDVDTIKMIKGHEGYRDTAYQCSEGVWTIGWGHTFGVKEGDTCTVEQADNWFFNDLVSAIIDADDLFTGFNSLSHNRQAVLIDMAFNLGYQRLRQFTDMRHAIRLSFFREAAKEMLDSKWAEQVGERAETLARLMREG